jgi:hypothetical protein
LTNEKQVTMDKTFDKISLLFILTIMLCSQVQAQSDYKLVEQDSLALVAFYQATDGPNWISNQDGFGMDGLSTEWQDVYDGGFSKWLEGPVKDWFGVKVEKRLIPNTTDSAYRVTWLWPVIGRRTDGQNGLDGYVPREVGLLTALEEFRVNGNNGFEWTELPDDLYHPTLTYLDIESAWFGGGISDAFRQCTRIQKMNFRYNYIDYMPTLDFLDADALYALGGTQWFYSTRLSFAIAEKNIDHFYTISANPKEFFVEYRDLFDVGDEQEIVASVGSPVELECTSAGEKEEFITYQWYKNGLSMFGKTQRTLSISSVKESDYADYTVKITNEYVKEYDQNSNYGEVFTKPFHLVAEPVPPVIEWAHSSYNGKEIILRLSKPMDVSASGFEGFTINSSSGPGNASAARTEGRLSRDLVITLDSPLEFDDAITLDYAGDGVIDQNGGALEDFSGINVENRVRPAAQLLSAVTTKDGSGVLAMFDKYIDPLSIQAADFSITRDGNGTIASASLFSGELDPHISKIVLLILEEPVTDSTEMLSLKYTRGDLAGLYSGVVNSSEELEISNEITLDLTEVLFTFEDGSNAIEDVLIEASWRLDPLQMYDDGTHGDTVAGDHNWALGTSLVDDSYTWDVISRITTITYDTTRVEDPETGIITLIATPKEVNNDSILSENVVLGFEVLNKEVAGVTSFGIMNLQVTFNVSLDHSSEEVYLMGIREDWGLGILMTPGEGNNQYTATLQGYTVGDVIEYNYRDGSTWENQAVEPRTYVVKATDNLVHDSFGNFTTSVENLWLREAFLYPNPVSEMLFIEGLENQTRIEIFSSSGQCMHQSLNQSERIFQSDVSAYLPGVYLVKLSSKEGRNLLLKFIKY